MCIRDSLYPFGSNQPTSWRHGVWYAHNRKTRDLLPHFPTYTFFLMAGQTEGSLRQSFPCIYRFDQSTPFSAPDTLAAALLLKPLQLFFAPLPLFLLFPLPLPRQMPCQAFAPPPFPPSPSFQHLPIPGSSLFPFPHAKKALRSNERRAFDLSLIHIYQNGGDPLRVDAQQFANQNLRCNGHFDTLLLVIKFTE